MNNDFGASGDVTPITKPFTFERVEHGVELHSTKDLANLYGVQNLFIDVIITGLKAKNLPCELNDVKGLLESNGLQPKQEINIPSFVRERNNMTPDRL